MGQFVQYLSVEYVNNGSHLNSIGQENMLIMGQFVQYWAGEYVDMQWVSLETNPKKWF